MPPIALRESGCAAVGISRLVDRDVGIGRPTSMRSRSRGQRALGWPAMVAIPRERFNAPRSVAWWSDKSYLLP